MNDYLMHYGVKGMKWGVRRTPEQLGHRKKKKLNAGDVKKRAAEVGAKAAGAARKAANAVGESTKKAAKVVGESAKKAAEEKKERKTAKSMTDDELRTALSRLRMEEEYSSLMSRQSERQTSAVKSFVKKHAASAVSQITEKAVSKAVNKLFEEKKEEERFDVSKFDFKDTSKVSGKDLQDAVKWYNSEKTYQKLRSEYNETRKAKEPEKKPRIAYKAKKKKKE